MARMLERSRSDEPVEVDLRCACGERETRCLEADGVTQALASVICQRCGVRGEMVPTGAVPLERPEIPPHPEEP